MSISDPISNLIVYLSNATAAGHDSVDVPASSFKNKIADLLQKEGVIVTHTEIEKESFKFLHIQLNPAFTHFKRLSKPGKRWYVKASALPRNKREIIILSTPRGLMTVKDAIKAHVGGELIMEVR